jgi:hypothetical protein
MKKKFVVTPLLIVIIFIVLGIGSIATALFIGGAGSGGDVNLQKGLVGQWKLDNDFKDSSPFGHNGGFSNGTACSSGNTCMSGNCVNGVCCNTACTGSTCQRCDSYSNAGAGTCGYVSTAVDPNNECGTTACLTGNCSGTGYTCGYNTSGEGACPTCQTCNGATSGSCVNVTNNTQDTQGSNVCTATCKKCSSGSCVNQGAEDLFGQCTAGYIVVANTPPNGGASQTCTYLCSNNTTAAASDLCGNGTGSCATAVPTGCGSIGTDTNGTNALYHTQVCGGEFGAYDSSGDCSTSLSDNCNLPYSGATQNANCHCQ